MLRGALRFGAAAAAGGAAWSWNSTVQADQRIPAPTFAFSPDEYRPFLLKRMRTVSHDTKVATFELPNANQKMGLTCSSFVTVRCRGEDGKDVIRPYTPISLESTGGEFELLVKKYPGGKCGTHIHSLVPNYDYLDIRGPYSKLAISSNQYKHIGLIAGGSGLTPVYQVARTLLSTAGDETKLSLVFANNTVEDILLKDDLLALERKFPHRFRVYHVVKDAPLGWQGGIGYVNKEQLKNFLPAPGEGKVLVCGPPGLMKHVSGECDYSSRPPKQGSLSGLLKDLGYSEDDVYKY